MKFLATFLRLFLVVDACVRCPDIEYDYYIDAWDDACSLCPLPPVPGTALSTTSPKPSTTTASSTTTPKATSTTASSPTPNVPDPEVPSREAPVTRFVCNIQDKRRSKTKCSCAIISPHFVLTVGKNCLVENTNTVSPHDIDVVYGDFEEIDLSELPQLVIHTFEVKSIVLNFHPKVPGDYRPEYDIAVVQTKDEMHFGGRLRPARLMKDEHLARVPKNDWRFTVLRLGDIQAYDVRHILYNVRVLQISSDVCRSVFGDDRFSAAYNICSNYLHNNTQKENDDCQADYGGVLSYEETALGVLTAKRSCGQKIKAAGFVNIGLNYKWIKEIVERLSVGKETVG